MNDMNAVIVPRSDQLNADSLMGGDLVIKITAVRVAPGQEQPVSMEFEGSNLVYRPCKSMARVMVAAWGPDSSAYVGRSLQLYRDPSVKWGGMDVGGIRIRAMSHMPNDRPMTMALTATKGSRKPYTVQPLQAGDAPKRPERAAADAIAPVAKAQAERGTVAFRAWLQTDRAKAAYADGSLTATLLDECRTIASGADNMAAMKDPLADANLPDPNPSIATDPELEAQIMRELAERNAALEA